MSARSSPSRTGTTDLASNSTFLIDEPASEARPPLPSAEAPLESPGNVTFDLNASCGGSEPPFSTPGSSLSKSLKFLEASHLLSDEEMISMGCQPPARSTAASMAPPSGDSGDSEPQLELSNASSLLTESLLNSSFGGAPMTSTGVKAQVSSGPRKEEGSPSVEVGGLFEGISESPISYEAGEQQLMKHEILDPGNDSEIDNATFSLKSHDFDSAPDKSLENSLNESELCSGDEPGHQAAAAADMEVLDKLSERSLSETNLTMRHEEAEESGSEAANAASLSKKKRTRSPTPSSVKTESVPAKRSLTLQRQRPTPSAGRPHSTASATTASAARRGSGMANSARQSGNAASSSSIAEKAGGRRSTAGPGGAKKASDTNVTRSAAAGSGTASSRRASMPQNRGAAGQGASGGASRTPRRSVSGSTGDVDAEFKKPAPRGASTLTRPTAASARREKSNTPSGSLSARSTTDGAAAAKGAANSSSSSAAAAATSGTANSGSRLKTPSLLQRTFSRKSTSRPASSAASSSPGGTPRGSMARSSAAVTNPGASASNLSSTSAARQKDSQLQPKGSDKAAGRSSTALTTAAAGAKSQTDGRPKNSASSSLTRGGPRATLSSNSSDVKSSSRCSSPESELRELVTSQTAQLAVQEARLSELVVRCAAQEKALAEGHVHLQEAVRAFTVMSTVCQTLDRNAEEALCAKRELERKLVEVITQTKEVASQCESLIREKEALQSEMAKEAEDFREKMSDLSRSHRTMLQNERSKLAKDKEEAVARVIDQHSAEVKTLKQFHDKEVQNHAGLTDMRMKELKEDYEKRLYRNMKMHENEVTELQNQHEKKIAEITQRFEDMKVTLSNRIQVLHMECNDLRSKSFEHDEHVRRNSATQLQVAIQQFQHLPEENASLKAVLDLRINENADLRRQNTELQAKIHELEEIRVKNDQLIRQNENLEAIISLKTENEKQLQERHQSLLRRYDRESKEKKRLSMGYEELLYKLEECQSSEDLTKRSLSDIPSMTSSAVVMRSHNSGSLPRPKHRGLQHDRSKRKTIASSRELD